MGLIAGSFRRFISSSLAALAVFTVAVVLLQKAPVVSFEAEVQYLTFDDNVRSVGVIEGRNAQVAHGAAVDSTSLSVGKWVEEAWKPASLLRPLNPIFQAVDRDRNGRHRELLLRRKS